MRDTLCLVLGGGRGTRLYPLTKDRSKPAVPFAGKYRLVDIPISNSLNSGLMQIYVLTQFNSESLNKHITRTYKLDSFSGGFVEIMAAEQSMESVDWFQGTADAVRRCLKHFNDPAIKNVLILSGDQLYTINFEKLISFHVEKNSEITIACNPIEPQAISEFGIIGIDKNSRVDNFVEKPENETKVTKMSLELNQRHAFLASMGIYFFNKDALVHILRTNTKSDFGKGILPDSFSNHRTYAYIHNGYWKDIGTIKTFYEENLAFTNPLPPFDLFNEQWQIFTRPRYLPSAKIEDSKLNRVFLAEGSFLQKCNVSHSVVGLRSRIQEGTEIEDTVVMGADYYESLNDLNEDREKGMPSIGIGKNCLIRKAIIDKNARIGDGVKIINQRSLDSFESATYTIRDSIIIIPKNTIIPSGTTI